MTYRFKQPLVKRAAGALTAGVRVGLAVLLAGSLAVLLLSRPVPEMAVQPERSVVEAYPLRITDPRLRQPLPGTTRTAGYLTLENLGPEPLVLVTVESPLPGRIEIHETLEREGRVRMERIDQLLLPAGETVAFEPGGKHLMLFGVTEQLPATVTLLFRFLSAKDQEISFRTYGITES